MEEKNRMRMARERAGFENEAAAARAIDCSRPLVIAWEKDQSDVTNSRYVYDVAVAYKVRPEWVRDPKEPDGFPWTPNESTNAPQTPKTAQRQDPTVERRQLDAIHLVLTALARVLAATKLDVAAILEDELQAIPEGPLRRSILGIVQREHARLKRQSPTSPGRKAQGSTKRSRA